MKKLLAALLIMISTPCCGPPVVTTCRAGPIIVEGEVDLRCDHVQNAVVLCKALYGASSARAVLNLEPEAGYSFEDPWPTFGESFDEQFAGARVVVESVSPVECGTLVQHKTSGGCTSNGVAYLERSEQLAFCHELMHVLECRRGNCHNVDHIGWDTNGFKSIDQAYRWGATDGGLFASTTLPEFVWTKE